MKTYANHLQQSQYDQFRACTNTNARSYYSYMHISNQSRCLPDDLLNGCQYKEMYLIEYNTFSPNIRMRGCSGSGVHGLKGFGTTLPQRYDNVILESLFRRRFEKLTLQKVSLERFKSNLITICVIALEMFLISNLETKQCRENTYFARIISFCKRKENVVRKTFYSSK